jgi:hypothetical protein
MRSAGAAALALVLALGLAPVAGAHDEASEGGEVTHRDTPAELASADIADALAAKGFELDRRKLQLADPIKKIGEVEVPVKLSRDVVATLKVKVVAE